MSLIQSMCKTPFHDLFPTTMRQRTQVSPTMSSSTLQSPHHSRLECTISRRRWIQDPTGVAIGAEQLGVSLQDLQRYPTGYEYLSSSGRYWQGYWVSASDVNLTFTAANVTAKVPILAVTESSICHNFQNGPCEQSSKTNITLWPNTINYLGQ